MSCEKQGGPYGQLSLVDGSVEQIHFKPVTFEELLRNDRKLLSKLASKVESESMDVGVKRPFVPFLTDVNMTGL